MVRGDKLRKLLLPGPYNYFGWQGAPPSAGGGAARAYAGLDVRRTGRLPGAAGPAAPIVTPDQAGA
jgi:hypothetical protein